MVRKIGSNGVYLLRIAKRLILTGGIHSKRYIEYLDSIEHQKTSFKKTILSFAVDVELIDSKDSKISRSIFDRLVSLTEKYPLHITWAVMGNISSEGFSFAYIADRLLQIGNQEIASHSFSHKDFSLIPESEAIADIENSIGCFERAGVRPATFIFPYNKAGHKDKVKAAGFTSYRGYSEETLKLDEAGLLVFPPGLCLNPSGFTSKEIISLIDKAVRHRAFIHLFTHLLEFRDDAELINFLEPIFSYVKICENNEQLDIMTMREITNDIGKGIPGLQ